VQADMTIIDTPQQPWGNWARKDFIISETVFNLKKKKKKNLLCFRKEKKE